MEWALGILYVFVFFIFTKFTPERDTITLKKNISDLYDKNNDNEDNIKVCMDKIYELEKTVSEFKKMHYEVAKQEYNEGKGYTDAFSHPQRPYWSIGLYKEEKITGYRLDISCILNISNILSDFCEELRTIPSDSIKDYIQNKNKKLNIKDDPFKDCYVFAYSNIYNSVSNQHIIYNDKKNICKGTVFISNIFNHELSKHILKSNSQYVLPPNELKFSRYGYLTTNLNQELYYDGYNYKEICHIPIYDIVDFMKNGMNNHREISVFPAKIKKILDKNGFRYSYEGENRSTHVFKNKYMELTLELDFNTVYGH